MFLNLYINRVTDQSLDLVFLKVVTGANNDMIIAEENVSYAGLASGLGTPDAIQGTTVVSRPIRSVDDDVFYVSWRDAAATATTAQYMELERLGD